MVKNRPSLIMFRFCYLLSFALLLFSTLALCGWLLLASMGLEWPIPKIVLYFACLFAAEIISLVLYFKRPWVAVLIGWIDMLMIVVGVVPRNSHSLLSFLHQFMFDVVFWVAANGGFAAYSALNRGKSAADRDSSIHKTQISNL
jgi:hypothetical protein